ncbi:hypothetical protein JL720_4170 [Aureococcus anophagefferens]|nr:hypothetical protein JL720_4170 [Aureococcus anophagefferens]
MWARRPPAPGPGMHGPAEDAGRRTAACSGTCGATSASGARRRARAPKLEEGFAVATEVRQREVSELEARVGDDVEPRVRRGSGEQQRGGGQDASVMPLRSASTTSTGWASFARVSRASPNCDALCMSVERGVEFGPVATAKRDAATKLDALEAELKEKHAAALERELARTRLELAANHDAALAAALSDSQARHDADLAAAKDAAELEAATARAAVDELNDALAASHEAAVKDLEAKHADRLGEAVDKAARRELEELARDGGRGPREERGPAGAGTPRARRGPPPRAAARRASAAEA